MGFGVRVLVLYLTYTAKHSSFPRILEIDKKKVIISFVLPTRKTARNYSRMANRNDKISPK